MQDAFHAALRRRVDALIAERCEHLSLGRVTSYEDYRYRVGAIEALRGVLDLAVEVQQKLYGENPLDKGDH